MFSIVLIIIEVVTFVFDFRLDAIGRSRQDLSGFLFLLHMKISIIIMEFMCTTYADL